MSSLLRLYKSGECEAVCQLLQEYGEAVNHGPLRSEAWDVARELVSRVVFNLVVIRDFLDDIGYEFAAPDVVQVATDQTADGVMSIQSKLGQVPLILNAWWEQIDSVDFSQSARQYHSGVGPQCEGLVPVDSLSTLGPQRALEFSGRMLAQLHHSNDEISEAIAQRPELRDVLIFNEVDDGFLTLGPCASNNEHMGVSCPCRNFDFRYFDDGGSATFFVEHLREVFGLAGLRFMFFGAGIAVETPTAQRRKILDSIVRRLKPI